jgi:hypothetical protein
LFSDINNNAVKVSGGDKVIIDEDDLDAIVTRRVYAEYPPFKGGEEIAVTEQTTMLIEDGQERFTNLLSLYTVCKKLRPLFKQAKGTLPNASENIEKFQAVVTEFFDYAIKHEPSFNSYFEHGVTSPEEERKNNKNLFFRPIGLELLARLYTQCKVDKSLPKLKNALSQWKFDNPGGVWEGVIWKNGKVDASASARNAAFLLSLYHMNELREEDEQQLLDLLRDVRNNPEYSLPEKTAVPKK